MVKAVLYIGKAITVYCHPVVRSFSRAYLIISSEVFTSFTLASIMSSIDHLKSRPNGPAERVLQSIRRQKICVKFLFILFTPHVSRRRPCQAHAALLSMGQLLAGYFGLSLIMVISFFSLFIDSFFIYTSSRIANGLSFKFSNLFNRRLALHHEVSVCCSL